MGTFNKSFARELGKNTAKAASTLIFRDLHATPYRRVGNTSRPRVQEYVEPRQPRVSKVELRHLELMEQLEVENRIKERLFNEQQEARKQNLQVEYISQMQVSLKKALGLSHDVKDSLQNYLNDIISVLETRVWHNKSELGYISSFDKNKLLLENQLADIYLAKLKDCHVSSSSYLTDSQRKFYKKIENKFEKRRLSTFFGAWGVFWFYISLIIKWFWEALFIKSKYKPLDSNCTTEVESTCDTELVTDDQSVFIDLNEENRIELKLADIWSRYFDLVDNDLLARKPIFSADAVKDSLLFVGVNPSFSTTDDDILTQSADSKSLMYGSLYQIENAPAYFRMMERFASQINMGYTHLNLLYVRENDRERLFDIDHNFIREQLELTYDTI
jgi:hypothetical protein